jgi:hypothetical protein
MLKIISREEHDATIDRANGIIASGRKRMISSFLTLGVPERHPLLVLLIEDPDWSYEAAAILLNEIQERKLLTRF